MLPAEAFAADPPADGGVDAHGFIPAAYDGDPRDPLTVERAGRFKQGEWFASGILEYADSPLRFTYDTKGGPVTEDVVDQLVALNLSGGAAVIDRLRLNISAPVYFTSTSWGTQEGPAIGDIRTSAMVAIIRPDNYWNGGGLGLAVVPYLDIPSGDEARFLGQSGVSGGGKVAATYEISRLTLSADLGALFQPDVSVANINGSDALTAGVAAGVLVTDQVGVNLEAHFTPPFSQSSEPGTNAPGEAIATVRGRLPSGPHLMLGGALGLNEGVGAATWRAFLGFGYGVITPPRPKDADLDGLLDEVDACPFEPETVNKYKDTDGCPDALSTVHLQVNYGGQPAPDAFVTVRGPDGDKEGSAANMPPAFETQPETSWEAVASRGPCLTGATNLTTKEGVNELSIELMPTRAAKVSYHVTDESGAAIPATEVHYTSSNRECIPDPMQLKEGYGAQSVGAGSHILYVEADNFGIYRQPVEIIEGRDVNVEVVLHPSKLRVEEEQIVILDKVYFEFNKAAIKPESYGLLDEVATTILANPRLTKIEIAGHTDNKGNDAYNMELSDQRAAEVRKYLIQKGVDASRLSSHGYGETRPLMDNKTEEGRSLNRRVEFNILEQTTGEQ
jgi:outer membrane protein OmpA-like peptidoglycan-associated protein